MPCSPETWPDVTEYAADAFARFLREAKDDLILATFNSREQADAAVAAGRRAPGMGTYWLPIE